MNPIKCLRKGKRNKGHGNIINYMTKIKKMLKDFDSLLYNQTPQICNTDFGTHHPLSLPWGDKRGLAGSANLKHRPCGQLRQREWGGRSACC